MKVKKSHLALRFLAPYLAVTVFWCLFSNAWLAILAYHAQILLWHRKSFLMVFRRTQAVGFLPALPTALAGLLLYFILPLITEMSLPLWLRQHHLSGISFLLMIPYFALIHPFLEQTHWESLRKRTPLAHLAFAGYHILVLSALLSPQWLLLCFCGLTATSFFWQWLTTHTKSLAPAILSHTLADLGVITAVFLLLTQMRI